jgi:hypothetical protein
MDSYKKVIVHSFLIHDLNDDPVLLAGEKLYEWEHSEPGQFIISRAKKMPKWTYYLDSLTYSYRFDISAEIDEKSITEYYLKWGRLLKETYERF